MKDEQEERVPDLQLNFFFSRDNFYTMDVIHNGHLGRSTGGSIKRTDGGKGGMSVDMMAEIDKAAQRFEWKRNFRVGSKVADRTGDQSYIIASIDYEAGKAQLEGGGGILLRRCVVLEW